MAVGEEAIAVEAVRERVKQEPANELVGCEGHDLGATVTAIILPAEGNLPV